MNAFVKWWKDEKTIQWVKEFQVNVPFVVYPLKTAENLRFWNIGLNWVKVLHQNRRVDSSNPTRRLTGL